MNQPHIPDGSPEGLDADLLVLLEDVLLHIDELHHQRADTTEIVRLLVYAASLRAKLP